jgi:hypothetical protein
MSLRRLSLAGASILDTHAGLSRLHVLEITWRMTIQTARERGSGDEIAYECPHPVTVRDWRCDCSNRSAGTERSHWQCSNRRSVYFAANHVRRPRWHSGVALRHPWIVAPWIEPQQYHGGDHRHANNPRHIHVNRLGERSGGGDVQRNPNCPLRAYGQVQFTITVLPAVASVPTSPWTLALLMVGLAGVGLLRLLPGQSS